MIGYTSTCTASFSRTDEWKRCCAAASGFEFVDCFDDDDDDDDNAIEIDDHDIFQVTNLLDDDDSDIIFGDDDVDGYKEVDIEDAWTVNALRISSDLNRMSHWIQSKKQKYVGLDMKDDEAALIQSTITSFAATTATELETLRKMIKSYNNTSVIINNNLTNHRSGIVQILLDQLQLQVTKPFGILQKQRTRVAVQLWQNPLQCKLYQPKRRTRRSEQPQDLLFDEDDEDDQLEHHEKEQRFLPERSYHHQEESNNNNGYDFISKYANKQPTRIPTEQPDFLTRILKRQEWNGMGMNEIETTKEQIVSETSDNFTSSFSDNNSNISQNFQSIPPSHREHQPAAATINNNNNNEYYQQQLEEELHTESVQLATVLVANNDLDSVQQMETRMVEITTLIGQFSNLVQDQQEQIVQVHESAKETKDNLDKGQENLIDAAERTKRSKHYKAWLILFLSMILMFFHLLRN
jgi:t-SNARE complex subunit (syntaxin)